MHTDNTVRTLTRFHLPTAQEQSVNLSNSNDVLFFVDKTSDLPVWVQLRNRIAYLIRTGRYTAGDQLPSVRSLAAEACINYNTVTKAYRDLELSGLITSVRGRGVFVQKNAESDCEATETADALFENCLQEYRACGMSFSDVRERIISKIDEQERKALAAEEERRQYGTL